MMLRASIQDKEADLSVIRRGTAGTAGQEGAVPFEKGLVALAEAIHSRSESDIEKAREEVAASLGGEALVDAVAVAAHFDAITRVADSTGIQLDAGLEAASRDVREELDLNDFYTNV